MKVIAVQIPSKRQPLKIERVVLDFNGTLAVDGKIIRGVATRLRRLAKLVHVTVMTADTYGNAARAMSGLPVEVQVIRRGAEKRRAVESLASKNVAVIGNGINDIPMFRAAKLSIAVVGDEGAASELLRASTIIVTDINDALDLLLMPNRLIATLRP